MQTLLPAIRVPSHGPLSASTLFGAPRPVWLEIGFGGGEHLLAQAERNAKAGFIGCEPFLDGVAKLLAGIDENKASNIRLWPDDVNDVLTRLEPATLSGVYILFPDPWPKRRQQKRRLVQPAFVARLHRVCKPGARVRFATDVRSYAEEAIAAFASEPGFAAIEACGPQVPPEDHVVTRYQQKQLGDMAPEWYDFRAIDCASKGEPVGST